MARDAARRRDRPDLGQGRISTSPGCSTGFWRCCPKANRFYPKDTLTDKTLRFFASEIIREKILRNYDKEIPYGCEIEIEEYTRGVRRSTAFRP